MNAPSQQQLSFRLNDYSVTIILDGTASVGQQKDYIEPDQGWQNLVVRDVLSQAMSAKDQTK